MVREQRSMNRRVATRKIFIMYMITDENVNTNGNGLREKVIQFQDLESMITALCSFEVLVMSPSGHVVKASPRLSVSVDTYLLRAPKTLINVYNVWNVPPNL